MSTDKPEVQEEMANREKSREAEDSIACSEKWMRENCKNTQPERNTNIRAQDLASRSSDTRNQQQKKYSNFYYVNLVAPLIFQKDNEELVQACQRELDRRWYAYKAWKEKDAPKEDEGDKSELPRAKLQRPPLVKTVVQAPDCSLYDYIVRGIRPKKRCSLIHGLPKGRFRESQC